MYEGYPPTQEASILSIRLCLNIKHKSLASIMSTSIKKKKEEGESCGRGWESCGVGQGKPWEGLGQLWEGLGKLWVGQ